MPKFSTGLRTGMLNDTGFKTLMDGGKLTIYHTASDDDIPPTADDEAVGDVLMELTAGGDGITGLTFKLPAAGILEKSDGEVWMATSIAATGSCSYFRFHPMSDDGTWSDTAPRIQGKCGLVNADMTLTNLNVTAGLPWTLNFFVVALPTE